MLADLTEEFVLFFLVGFLEFIVLTWKGAGSWVLGVGGPD